tara:strand:+ start:4840 stop:4998 length:159 start_codon:yes stop_codon:yes gene_type:complete
MFGFLCVKTDLKTKPTHLFSSAPAFGNKKPPRLFSSAAGIFWNGCDAIRFNV